MKFESDLSVLLTLNHFLVYLILFLSLIFYNSENFRSIRDLTVVKYHSRNKIKTTTEVIVGYQNSR